MKLFFKSCNGLTAVGVKEKVVFNLGNSILKHPSTLVSIRKKWCQSKKLYYETPFQVLTSPFLYSHSRVSRQNNQYQQLQSEE